MKFSNYILKFLNENEERESELKQIKEYFKGIENKNLSNDLIKLADIFGIKSQNSKTVEIVYNKDDGSTMRELSRKYGISITPDRHQAMLIPSKNLTLRIRLTGAKIGGSGQLGKLKNDLTEKATIMSVYNTLSEIQTFLKDYPDLYLSWKGTFEETSKAIKSIIKNVNNYVCIHDGSGEVYNGKNFSKDGGFSNLISKIGRFEFSSKDAYTPADIWFVKKSEYDNILKLLNEFVKEPESAVDRCNALILKSYEDGDLYPISLKKLEGKAKIEIHKDKVLPVYKVDPINIDLNMGLTGAMLGQYKYKNDGESGVIRFKMRATTLGYTMAQTEFESDGSSGSGKSAMVGKCPTKDLDKIMKDYNHKRIDSIKYFGGTKNGPYFTEATPQKIKEWFDMYKYCASKGYVTDKYPLKSLEDMKSLVGKAKNDYDSAARLCIKIQGLFLLYFLCKEDKHISDIITRMLNAAKKISARNAFFIKIC